MIRFQLYNANKPPEMLHLEEKDIYARPLDNRIPARVSDVFISGWGQLLVINDM